MAHYIQGLTWADCMYQERKEEEDYGQLLGKASLAEYVENANEPSLRKLKDEEMVKYENPLQEKKQHIFKRKRNQMEE